MTASIRQTVELAMSDTTNYDDAVAPYVQQGKMGKTVDAVVAALTEAGYGAPADPDTIKVGDRVRSLDVDPVEGVVVDIIPAYSRWPVVVDTGGGSDGTHLFSFDEVTKNF